MHASCFVSVSDTSEVGTARRHAIRVAEVAGFDETARARVAIVATELANNLILHANGGKVSAEVVSSNGARVLQLVSIDSGPGMHNPAECIRDGFSTRGTQGTGLGAVKRASSDFEIFSQVGKGTIVMSRIVPDSSLSAPQVQRAAEWRWAVVSSAAPGEEVSGDSWRVAYDERGLGVMVADGLGHGPLAHAASEKAGSIFEASTPGALTLFLKKAHGELRTTRGAAVAAVHAVSDAQTLTWAGIGNISGVLISATGTSKSLMSHNGTIGAEMRSIQELTLPWAAGDKLVMHSDGITTRWSVSAYPGLHQHHPAIICAVIIRDNLRGRDDATVLVLERSN